MLKKWVLVFVALWGVSLLYACSGSAEEEDDHGESKLLAIANVSGLDDTTHPQHAYFNPLRDVRITNQDGLDITHYLHVEGFVSYGQLGRYTLEYQMTYGDDQLSVTRQIDVVDQPIQQSPYSRVPENDGIITKGQGSYKVGTDSTIAHPVAPQFIDPYLLQQAVPSNGWWTTLLVQNYGGGNGIYTNPLRTAFSPLGIEITNPGEGFVQYWQPEGLNTMAHFSLALPDLYLKSSNLANEYRTQVINYSDTTVSVAMRNHQSLTDEMVVHLAQGSPFVFAEFSNPESPYIRLAANGVASYAFYTVEGTPIQGTQVESNGIIVRLVEKHVGYETWRPAQVGQPTYQDRYFLISTPDGSTFNFSSEQHPFGHLNTIRMDLNGGHYLSVATLPTLEAAPFFHQHAFNPILHGDVSYTINHTKSEVMTTYRSAYQSLQPVQDSTVLKYLMPHHIEQWVPQTLTPHTIRTVRGELNLLAGEAFETQLPFHGVIPTMPVSEGDGFDVTTLETYLEDLATRTLIHDQSNFLNAPGPYWNSKAIYPLAQGIALADQLGLDDLKHELIGRLRYVLTDWFSVSGPTDNRYLFHNEIWGAVYYSNNDFNTAAELSDHVFTHGYLVHAAAILAKHDFNFVSEYGDVVDLLLRGTMHPEKQDETFAYLRSFDPWAGHTWAHGFGTFAEGNNLESSSEALNGWVGGYLWALVTGDDQLRDAAIYGFVHELHHAKTYMFDYTETVFPEAYSRYAQVAGMIWGGKYDYATWFGANPTFIYGIQWLPTGEYLSSYALDDQEFARLNTIFSTYLDAKNNQIDTWFANMWSIQALLNPQTALAQFNADLILQDDYPNELAQTYALLHSLNTYGRRTTDYVMQIHDVVASSIYVDSQGAVHALVWNPARTAQTVRFQTPNGSVLTETVPPESLIPIRLNP